MRMYDLIVKKRDGGTLTADEIAFFVRGVTEGAFPDEQIAAFLMAVLFVGMTDEETVALTLQMAHSGDMIDLSGIKGIKVDKHSTGGVGDKTTLVVAPIVAACGESGGEGGVGGVKVAKMSGKGLGHTGGTVDKLAAIPGFKTELPQEDFFRVVNEHGLCVVGQSGHLAPADKKLYALRDVTGTVESLPLIAASIMSKKLAAGADCIVLDVKMGSGAFMKTIEDAAKLARAMVAIGEGAGLKTVALITEMNRPLGYAIGNALEVIEAVETLQGRGPGDLHTLCVELAAHMIELAGKGTLDECRVQAETVLRNGEAFKKLCDMVKAQGGDAEALTDYSRLPQAAIHYSLRAQTDGYIQSMDTEGWGIASVKLGAGRETKESPIDYGAGIVLRKKVGDYVRAGDELAVLHTNNEKSVPDAAETARNAMVIGKEKPGEEPLIYARVDKNGITAAAPLHNA